MLTAFIGNNSKFGVLLFPFSEITTLTATNWASMSAAVSSVLLKSAARHMAEPSGNNHATTTYESDCHKERYRLIRI